MKIANISTAIAGNDMACKLNQQHEKVVFEAFAGRVTGDVQMHLVRSDARNEGWIDA